MKTKDIAAEYGIDKEEFDNFLKNNPDYKYKMNVSVTGSIDLYGFAVNTAVNEFKLSKSYVNLKETLDENEIDINSFKQFLSENYVSQFKEYSNELYLSKDLNTNKIVHDYLANLGKLPKSEALSSMLITSGFNFDGYTITKYSGYISGDGLISVDRGVVFLGTNSNNVQSELMKSLSTIRREALNKLKESAYDLGCNAVIGVDFDYITLDPQTANLRGGTTYQPYLFGVTANGNAVVIEKSK